MSWFGRRGIARDYEVADMFSSTALRVQPRGTVESGWAAPVYVGHLCWPPRQYPTGYGPDSVWRCGCGVEWRAEGMRQIPGSTYPLRPGREDAFAGPWRWLYQRGIKNGPWICSLSFTEEMGMYDWRTSDMVVLPLLQDIAQRLCGGI